MKRKTTFLAKAFLMLFAVLFSFTGARADEFTVYADGEATSGNVPVEGYWADSYQKCEFVIAQAELTPLAGCTISQMTFYLASPATIAWGGNFVVFLKEVSETTLSAFSGMDDATVVFEGPLDATQSTLTLAFSNLFTYNGGNLLVGVYETEKGSYKSASFAGAEVEGASIQGHSSNSLDEVTANQKNFIPKTTFTYFEAGALIPPSGLKVSYTGGTEATISWSSDEDYFDIEVNGAVTEDVDNPCTLSGLELATTYTIRVRSKKGTEVSDWAGPISFSTDLSDDMCQIQLVLTDAYGDGWSGAALVITDVDTGIEIGNVTLASGSESTFTINVPNNRDIEFSWVSGTWPSYEYECGFVVTDINEDVLLEHVGSSSSSSGTNPTAGVLLTWHVNCTVTPWKAPTNLAASEIATTSVKLSWTENSITPATSWVVAYKADSETDFTEVTATTNPYVLEGLTADTKYTVKVRPATTEVEKWSDYISFTTEVAFPAPTNIAVVPAAETAEISWTGNDEATSYNLRYIESNSAGDFFDDFENGLDDWTLIVNAEGTGWQTFDATQFQGGSNHSGDYVAMARSYEGGVDITADNWMITPQITIGNTMTYWARNDGRDDHLYDETYDVCVSTTSNNPEDFVIVQTFTTTPEEWEQITIDLSAYNGQQGYVAFHHHDAEKDVLLIDDVTIAASSTSTVVWTTVNNVTNPYTIEGLSPETKYNVEVQAVYEGGESNWTTIIFTTPSSNPVPSDIVADLVADGATLTWEGQGESYNAQYRTAESAGAATFADQLSDNLDQWTIITAGEGPGWAVSEYGATAYSYENGVGAYNADNWLISPAVELGGILKFYANTATAYPDSYEVLLSTTGTETTDFTETLQALAPATPGYVTIDLSAYAGTGYIAIHHVCSDCYILAISNFGVYEQNVPASAWQDMAVTEKTASVSGLATNTLYEYRVQSVKGDNTSEWSAIQDFALLTLDSDADNTSLINQYNGKYAHVTLANRTLYQNNTWNTIYLPFDMSIAEYEASLLEDADIRSLKNVTVEDDNVTLNFTEEGTTLDYFGGKYYGGLAYIVKWASGSNIVNPEFANVTITNTQYYVGDQNKVKFVGTYAPINFTADNPSILFIGAENKLNYPLIGASISAFRGYFQLVGFTAEESSGVKIFTNLDDEDPTGIANIENGADNGDWYDLSGRKLAGKPIMKGIYVNGGRKVTVK